VSKAIYQMSSVFKHDENICNTTYHDNIIIISSNAMSVIEFEANESIPEIAFLVYVNFHGKVAGGRPELILQLVLL
jgi:hypothetical protein